MNKTTLKTVILLLVIVGLNSCQIARYVFYNFADITDYRIFPSRPVDAPAEKFYFARADGAGRIPKSVNYGDEGEMSLDEFLEKNKTVAFLVIKNDTILKESYYKNYDSASIVASFSMAKSFLSALIGIAIEEGYIDSVGEPVTNYIPELSDNGFDKVTLHHLLQMTSGLDFNESYSNPFGDAATFYYGTNLRKNIAKMETTSPPGKKFSYKSGNTQLLGLVLDRALGEKTISEYLGEKLWKPLGMEYDASWSIDRKKNGLEKTFCCINARAIDFAKFGRLYLNGGKWEGRQVVPKAWVENSTRIDTSGASPWYYQYQWWKAVNSGDFHAQGYLGQYIYVSPATNTIIVRLGKNYGKVDWQYFLSSLAASLKDTRREK